MCCWIWKVASFTFLTLATFIVFDLTRYIWASLYLIALCLTTISVFFAKPSQWRHVCFHGRFTHHPRTRTTSTEILHPTLLPSPPAVCLQALSSVSSVPKARARFTFRRRFDRQVLISAKKKKPADSHTVNFLSVWPFGVIVDGDVESNPRKLHNNQTFQFLLHFNTLFCMC